MPTLSVETLADYGRRYAIAWLKYAYQPKALKTYFGSPKESIFIPQTTYADAQLFIERVIAYFRQLNDDPDKELPSLIWHMTDYAPQDKLKPLVEGLKVYLPWKAYMCISLFTGRIKQNMGGGRSEDKSLIHTPCSDKPEDVTSIIEQFKKFLSSLPLNESTKDNYIKELQANLDEIIAEFDFIKAYSELNLISEFSLRQESETKLTPKYLAQQAQVRIEEKVLKEMLQPLTTDIVNLQTHVKAGSGNHRKKASEWAATLLSTITALTERKIDFPEFRRQFDDKCKPDAIKSFTAYKDGLQKIVRAFLQLIYRATNVQFFKPGAATDELSLNVIKAQGMLQNSDKKEPHPSTKCSP